MRSRNLKPWKQRKRIDSALDSQRALLDQLMGVARDIDGPEGDKLREEAERKKRWDDEDMCPYFLCGFCPHNLFTNTKADIGCCRYEHHEAAKEAYENVSRRKKRRVERRMLYKLHQLVAELIQWFQPVRDSYVIAGRRSVAPKSSGSAPVESWRPTWLKPQVDRKISRGKRRIEMHKQPVDPEKLERRNRELDTKMEKLLGEMELLGDQGKVDEAQSLLRQVEELQKQKDGGQLIRPGGGEGFEASELNCCEICGVFQAVNDSESRVQCHLSGKQHRGYQRIRQKIVELETLHEQMDREERGRDSKEKPADRSSRGSRSRKRSRSRSKKVKREKDDREKDVRDKPVAEEKEEGEAEATSSSSKRRRRRSRSRDRGRDRDRRSRRHRSRDYDYEDARSRRRR